MEAAENEPCSRPEAVPFENPLQGGFAMGWIDDLHE
jgi:hypothetical protein